MADEQHVTIIRASVETWNNWRHTNPGLQPDLAYSNLDGIDLSRANLDWTNLFGASLQGTTLTGASLIRANLMMVNASATICTRADFRGAIFTSPNADHALTSGTSFSSADLTGANLTKVDLTGVKFVNARLCGASLSGSILEGSDLRHADLSGADLSGTLLIETALQGANLKDCIVYGTSVWNAQLDGAEQTNLRVSRWNEPALIVDNLEVAQFLYLIVNNAKLRNVIDTITSKVILILGRFTPERKAVLNALREEIRRHNYVPILFDFDKSKSRDLTETVSTLAHMARFIVADITDSKSIPQELQAIVPNLPSVPIQPILLGGEREYGMFEHFQQYPWVLKTYQYQDTEALLAEFTERVLQPAEQFIEAKRARGYPD